MRPATAAAPKPEPSRADRPATFAAALTGLGIVYGDLGTSPLYTYPTILAAAGHPTPADAMGLLSLVVWTLLITVSLKYCVFVMRADNHGEGGILALMALVTHGAHSSDSPDAKPRRARALLIAAGLFGAALIYGDGMITPAVSVFSALEGLDVITHAFHPYIMPAALLILLALFTAQRWGTARIGRIFGPVMLLWLLTIATLGATGIIRRPEVLWAASPTHAIAFLTHHGLKSFLVLGGVFLAITGGEALYADMGHIGRNPIRSAWYCVVLPALLLSYAGQTALLMSDPDGRGSPFFRLAPAWSVVPLVILATLATIIASQAIITGAFSLTRQAMQLGWFPGLEIRQTSDDEYGQIYVPVVNWTMMLGTLALTAGFGSSERLAGAFGTAVSTTMLLTTALLFNAMRDIWKWPVALAAAIAGALLLVDLGFFAANLLKIAAGGWIPLAAAAVIYLIMTTWHAGTAALRRHLRSNEETNDDFLAELRAGHIPRVPGTAVFLSRSATAIPPLMRRHIEQFKALQQTAVSLTVTFDETPRITQGPRATAEHIEAGLWHVTIRFGFVEIPNLAQALASARAQGCPIDLDDAIYIAAHDEIIRSPTRARLTPWRRKLFSIMYRNAVRAPDRFDLPADKFLEVGRQVAL